MIRRILAGLMALAALWLLWEGIHPVQVIVSRGSPLVDALLNPPTSIWRIAAALLLLAGSALAALNLRWGGVLALIGAILFTALGALLALMGTDSRMWMSELVTGGILTLLSGALLFMKRA